MTDYLVFDERSQQIKDNLKILSEDAKKVSFTYKGEVSEVDIKTFLSVIGVTAVNPFHSFERVKEGFNVTVENKRAAIEELVKDERISATVRRDSKYYIPYNYGECEILEVIAPYVVDFTRVSEIKFKVAIRHVGIHTLGVSDLFIYNGGECISDYFIFEAIVGKINVKVIIKEGLCSILAEA